ncbi:mucosal addressin cell adhesion molecule 1 [Aegotheles albertisi]
MEPVPLLLLFLLSSLRGCSGQLREKLSVTPREPVVRFGGSVLLNCSLRCAGGTVQWKGLDTNLGGVTSFPTHSILRISSAVVATEGTKICQGSCHGQHYQDTVNLRVYALPDRLELEAEPPTAVPGLPLTLRCSARGVHPLTGLALAWYRGDRALEGTEFDVTETEEELFDIVSTLPLAGEEVGDGEEFRCEVTLSVGQETFSRVASVAVSTGAVREQPVPRTTSGSPRTAAATAVPVTSTALPPQPTVPAHDPTAAPATAPRDPDTETPPESAATTEPRATARPAPRDLGTGRATARPVTASPGAGTPAAAGASTGWGSGPAEEGPGQPVGTVPPCSLRVWSLPPNGTRGRALRIECRARCPGNGTVRWLRTPVALSQYREEAAGSGSTLRLDRAEPRHQGRYQCVLLGPRSQAATLHLRVLDDPSSPGPAVAAGTSLSLLGLIVSGAVSRRLWKRFRSQYELP